MRPDYQELWGLTDKEYIYFLEGYCFNSNNRFKKIEEKKGYCCVTIPDDPPYGIYFKDGIRISEDEWHKFIQENKIFPPLL